MIERITGEGARVSGPTILTADGAYFDFEQPGEGITLNAIARGLSNTCRFAGQCDRFYSVAEHSVHVSRIVPAEFALAGLLHDAAEAFICDMPKPLKELLPDYQEVERRIEHVLFPRFGLPVKLPPEVKAADRQMLATEQRQLLRNRDSWNLTAGIVPAPVRLECLYPNQAYWFFIHRAVELGLEA